jgi:voltage-gated potassium channel Kch
VTPSQVDKLRRAGVGQPVSPYDLSGSRMAALALHRAIVSFLDMVRVAH